MPNSPVAGGVPPHDTLQLHRAVKLLLMDASGKDITFIVALFLTMSVLSLFGNVLLVAIAFY